MTRIDKVQNDKSALKGGVSPRQAVLDFNQETGISITFNGKPIEKKSAPIVPPKGVTADQIKTVVDHLKTALKSSNSKYNLENVKAKLQAKGISLEKLMDKVKDILVGGLFPLDNLSDDEVIKAALQAAGLSADEIAGLELKTVEAKPELALAELPTLEDSAKPEAAKPAAPGPGTKAPATPAPAVAVTNHYPAGATDPQKQAIDLILKLNPRIMKNSALVKLLYEAVANNSIDLDEARALGINGKEDQLFRAVDNKMVAGQFGGDGKISIDELVEAVKVMNEFADLAGIKFDQAAERFSSMYLVNIDYNGIRDKAGELAKLAGSLPLPDGLSDKDIAEKLKDLKAKLADGLYDILVSKIKHKEITSAQAVGKFATHCALASLTSHYENLPEVEELIKSGKLTQFKPRKPETSAADFAEWVKEGKLKEEKEAGASEKADDQKQRELLSKLQLAKKPSEALELYKKNYSELKGSTQALELLKQSLSTALKLAIEKKELAGLIDEYKSYEKAIDGLDSEVRSGLKGNVYAYKFQLAMELAKSDKKTDKELAYGVIDSIPDGNKISWANTDEQSGKVSSVSLTKAEAKFTIAHRILKETGPMDAVINEPAKASPIEIAAAYLYRAEVRLERAKNNQEREAAFADFKEAYKKAAASEAEKDDAQKAIEYRDNAKNGMLKANDAINRTKIFGKDKSTKAANKELDTLVKRLQKEFAETIKGETKTEPAKTGQTHKAKASGSEKKTGLDAGLISLAKSRISEAYGSGITKKIFWELFKIDGKPIDDAVKAKVRAYIKKELKKEWELADDSIQKKK